MRHTCHRRINRIGRIFGGAAIATAVLFSMTGYFNGSGQTLFVMFQGLFQTLLLRLPMSYYMSIQTDAI